VILERAALAGVLSGLLLSGSAAAQVLKVAEMNTDAIRGFDRQRTAVILPGGILEQHGPYLPSYSDGYYGERMAWDLAEAVAARPGWTALVFPPLALGARGANEIGGKRAFPGTFTVRVATLRAIYMDLASQLGEQGFRWVFIVHNHGGPAHNRVLDEAADYFQDTYGGRMVHLLETMDVVACCEGWRRLVSAEALAENGLSVHAGLLEQSGVLFLRPDLVVAAAMRILDGAAATAAPRYSDEIIKNPVVAQVVSDSLARDRELEARQEAWLKKQSPWPPGPRR
jgi:creatinine amidohydrolase/Fe(II)-dependent formamide hydrolase-like protein